MTLKFRVRPTDFVYFTSVWREDPADAYRRELVAVAATNEPCQPVDGFQFQMVPTADASYSQMINKVVACAREIARVSRVTWIPSLDPRGAAVIREDVVSSTALCESLGWKDPASSFSGVLTDEFGERPESEPAETRKRIFPGEFAFFTAIYRNSGGTRELIATVSTDAPCPTVDGFEFEATPTNDERFQQIRNRAIACVRQLQHIGWVAAFGTGVVTIREDVFRSSLSLRQGLGIKESDSRFIRHL